MATTSKKPSKIAKKEATAAKAAKEFAVIQTGGKQYMVSEGDVVKIEAMKGELTAEGREVYKVGDKLTFEEVLLVDNGKDTSIGDPFIKGAKVMAEIKKIDRAAKVTVIKYKAKSNYFKKRGHRQPFFEVVITKLA
ncbi:MAG: ribosomal protein large subunit ribosomal protein [Candidatus Adlerbacteria bacterium]|nr:ribosomal protein large subunit ribosomal protein [Candidatus Adlerbacteria bacterium]